MKKTDGIPVLVDGAYAMLRPTLESFEYGPRSLSEFYDRLTHAPGTTTTEPSQPRLPDYGEFLTINQAARVLKVTPRTIRAWIKAGTLPAFKVKRAVRISSLALANMLACKSTAANQ